METLEPDIKKGEGYENDFQAAMERVDQDYLNEIVNATMTDAAGKSSDFVPIKDDGTTVDDIKKMREV